MTYGECEKCGGELRRDGISCPDGREGCAVFHFKESCPTCIKWDNADFYSLSDQDEHLQFSDVGELLEDYIDQNGDEADWPVTVYAWARMGKPTSKEVLAMAHDLVESTESWWHDQWGDPDGGFNKGTSTLEGAFDRALQEWVECQTVWACEVVGKREVNKDDV